MLWGACPAACPSRTNVAMTIAGHSLRLGSNHACTCVHYSAVAICKQVIVDKNKNDANVQIIALGQIFWLVRSIVGRRAQHRAIIIFELTTIASIIFMLATYICGANKTSNILTDTVLAIDVTVAETCIKANRVRGPVTVSDH